MSFYAQYPASSSGSNASVGVNCNTAPSSSTEIGGIDSGTGNLVPVSVDSSGHVNVNTTGLPASLGQKTMAQSTSVAIASDQSTVPVADSALTTIVNARLTGSLVPAAYDEIDITYVGSTTAINTVQYKLATVLVATLTMAYDGSNRLTSVVKS